MVLTLHAKYFYEDLASKNRGGDDDNSTNLKDLCYGSWSDLTMTFSGSVSYIYNLYWKSSLRIQ